MTIQKRRLRTYAEWKISLGLRLLDFPLQSIILIRVLHTYMYPECITEDNLSYCKELINLTSEVRHMEDVVGAR
jgi:hypothetical protein